MKFYMEGDAFEGHLGFVFLNPIALTIPEWHMFKTFEVDAGKVDRYFFKEFCVLEREG